LIEPSESADPASPITQLAAAAIQLHELYRSYVTAGFTEEQAMQIILAIVTPRPNGGAQT